MTIKTSIIAIAMVTAALTAPTVSSAATIDWTLSNVTFSDGATASGTFSTNAGNGHVTAFDFVTTVGSVRSATTYTAANSFNFSTVQTSSAFSIADNDYAQALFLHFADPLTSIGTKLLLSDSEESNLGNATASRWATGSATGVVSAVPEPATWALMIGGLGLVGMTMRRRAAATTSITA